MKQWTPKYSDRSKTRLKTRSYQLSDQDYITLKKTTPKFIKTATLVRNLILDYLKNRR